MRRGKAVGAEAAGGYVKRKIGHEMLYNLYMLQGSLVQNAGKPKGNAQSRANFGGSAGKFTLISINIEITLASAGYFAISRIMKHSTVHNLDIEVAASTFAALGSEQRLMVLRCLVRAGPEGLRIGELGERSGVTGSTLTHHMKILAQAGLVTQARHGRSIICAAVAYDELQNLSEFLLRECCADSDHPHEGHEHG
jgi:DNA-binding transcriptional ArsR family regulator